MDTAPATFPIGDAEVSADLNPDRENFLEFQYPELKDLAKHFLTIVSASLAFTATFAEKLLDLSDATRMQKGLLTSTLALLIVSVVAVGTGVYFNYRAGSRARGSVINRGKKEFTYYLRRTYWLYVAGGVAFILALVLLGAIAILKIISPVESRTTPPVSFSSHFTTIVVRMDQRPAEAWRAVAFDPVRPLPFTRLARRDVVVGPDRDRVPATATARTGWGGPRRFRPRAG